MLERFLHIARGQWLRKAILRTHLRRLQTACQMLPLPQHRTLRLLVARWDLHQSTPLLSSQSISPSDLAPRTRRPMPCMSCSSGPFRLVSWSLPVLSRRVIAIHSMGTMRPLSHNDWELPLPGRVPRSSSRTPCFPRYTVKIRGTTFSDRVHHSFIVLVTQPHG